MREQFTILNFRPDSLSMIDTVNLEDEWLPILFGQSV